MKRFSELFTLDLRSLALLRIGLGIFIFIEILELIPYVKMFLSDSGVAPRSIIDLSNREFAYHWQLYFLHGGELWAYFLLGITLLSASFLIVGYYTKLATFLCWILLASLQQRNPHLVYGGHSLSLMLLFWSIFLPLGARFSLDRAIRKLNFSSKDEIISVASIALYFQFIILYITAALYKFDFASWGEGTHIYYTLSRMELVWGLGHLIYPYPHIMEQLTYNTLMLELLGPLLIFCPFFKPIVRLFTLTLFALFHLGLALTVSIQWFPLLNIVFLSAFLPAFFWDNILRVKATPAPLSNPHSVQSRFNSVRSFLVNCLVLFCLLYYTAWHIYGASPKEMPPRLTPPIFFLFSEIRWNMFTQTPKYSGWWAIRLEDNTGDSRELLSKTKFSTDLPQDYFSNLPNPLKSYLSTLTHKPDPKRCKFFLEYFLKQESDRLEQAPAIELLYIRREILPEYRPSPFMNQTLCRLE